MSKNSVEELLAQLFTDENSNSHQEEQQEDEEKLEQVYVLNGSLENVIEFFVQKDNLDNEVTDESFCKLFRMNRTTFSDLQEELENLDNIENEKKFDTNLLFVLWMLGNTAPLSEISSLLGITENHIFMICEKYFRKIIQLSPKYVTWPTPCEMITIENAFKTKYDFPSIIGAIGCLHIAVQMSDNITDCAEYFNLNTGQYTIILQAVCDSNLLFRDIFVGYPGSNDVQSILRASDLHEKLIDEDSTLVKLKKHLLGGTEHPQLDTLLTPYPCESRTLTEPQLQFNNLHSSAMLVIDKTFNIIENRFQRMKCLDSTEVEFAIRAVGAICTLHNFTRIRNDILD